MAQPAPCAEAVAHPCLAVEVAHPCLVAAVAQTLPLEVAHHKLGLAEVAGQFAVKSASAAGQIQEALGQTRAVPAAGQTRAEPAAAGQIQEEAGQIHRVRAAEHPMPSWAEAAGAHRIARVRLRSAEADHIHPLAWRMQPAQTSCCAAAAIPRARALQSELAAVRNRPPRAPLCD